MGPLIHQVGESPEHGGQDAQSRVRRGKQTYPRAQAGGDGPLGRGPLVVGRRTVAAASAAAGKVGGVVVEVFGSVGAELVGRVEVAAKVRVESELVEARLLKRYTYYMLCLCYTNVDAWVGAYSEIYSTLRN